MTNFYTIQTIEFHKAAIVAQEEKAAKRTEDVGLSAWADDSVISFHRAAIAALELGTEHGINGPAMMAMRLMEGDRMVKATQKMGKFGPVWLLAADEAAKFGRKFIPVGVVGSSIVQKKLGLSQTRMVAPAQRQMEYTATTAGMTFILQEAPKAATHNDRDDCDRYGGLENY
jgi:hypothetical protein